ncbi:MAG: relaxase/mobilization nuclease domain-containing protein [Burkholderiales bacterium]|nr:relaxase/mobilization nuclease domain-containing protein [Burkholderiales bacterium]
MTTTQAIDTVLVHWGERLFEPRNRIVKPDPAPRLCGSVRAKAAQVRQHIEATVIRRAPQAILKVAGGGRGMKAIASHFRYISRDGQLELEDDRGVRHAEKESILDLLDQWRYGGRLIDDLSSRREALNLVLSTPTGTNPQLVLEAARKFAQAELNGHRYVMVLHSDRDNPHVHLTVRAESASGQRLTSWTERERWRTVYADVLRGLGVDVEATRQSARGENRNFDTLGRLKMKAQGELRHPLTATKAGDAYAKSRAEAMQAWSHIMKALETSESAEDRKLAQGIAAFVRSTAFYREAVQRQERQAVLAARERPGISVQPGWDRSQPGPEITR